jgi:rubrerythrin
VRATTGNALSAPRSSNAKQWFAGIAGRDLPPETPDAKPAASACHKCGSPMRDIDGNRYCPVCGVYWK